MRRRWTALLLAACTAVALGGDAGGAFVPAGGSLSASSLRAALDARSVARDLVREQLIDARRTQVSLRDRVAFLEQEFAPSSAASVAGVPSVEADALEAAVDPWTEAGIVSGRITNADAVNAVFAAWVTDVSNFREFQSLVVRDLDLLFERAEALEDLAGILDPPAADPLLPNEDEFSVPHAFATGSVMRASEMNANLQAVDAGLAEEGAMAAGIIAQLALLQGRIEALEVALDLEPSFTWRIGTFNTVSGIETEAFYAYRSVGPFAPFTITVTGPAGFERDVSATMPGVGGVGWVEPPLPSGTYTTVTTVSGVDFAIPIVFDVSRVLDRPSVTVQAVSTTEVAVAIGRVDGAAMYEITLSRAGGSRLRTTWSGAFGGSTRTVTFTDLDLDSGGSYEVSVTTATTSMFELSSPTLAPQQVDQSRTVTEPFSLSTGD